MIGSDVWDRYEKVWQEVFAKGLVTTEVTAADRESAVVAAADQIGPYRTEKEWLIGLIDHYVCHNKSPNQCLNVPDRDVVIDVVLESAFTPPLDPTGPAIDWEGATAEEQRRAWLDMQPDAILARWYRHVRGLEQVTV